MLGNIVDQLIKCHKITPFVTDWGYYNGTGKRNDFSHTFQNFK